MTSLDRLGSVAPSVPAAQPASMPMTPVAPPGLAPARLHADTALVSQRGNSPAVTVDLASPVYGAVQPVGSIFSTRSSGTPARVAQAALALFARLDTDRNQLLSPAELELATAGPDGLWLSVIEKAFAHMKNGERAKPFLNPYEAIHFSQVYTGMVSLKGQQIPTVHLTNQFTLWNLASQLGDNLANGAVVVAGTPPSPQADSGRTRDGLATSHVYTVLAVDPATHLITVRNPWGNTGPAGDGVHRLTPEQFQANFTSFVVDGEGSQRTVNEWYEYFSGRRDMPQWH